MPIESPSGFPHGHSLEVRERDNPTLLDRQLLDRLADLPNAVLGEQSVFWILAELVGDRPRHLSRHDLRAASFGFKLALRPPPGAGDQPAGRILDVLAVVDLAAVFERGGSQEVVAVLLDESRREPLAPKELFEAESGRLKLTLA